MQLTVNGDVQDVEDNLTIANLLVSMDLDPEQKGIAVAINAEVIARSAWPDMRLNDGDRMDIIHAVQGG